MESVEDISTRVLEGLRLDGPHREAEIAKKTPKSLAPVVKSFAGTKASDVYLSFQNGRLKDVIFEASKPTS